MFGEERKVRKVLKQRVKAFLFQWIMDAECLIKC